MRFRCVAAMSLIITLAASAAHADGDIDTSFGSLGLGATGITNAIPGAPRPGPVVQSDGKILIAGTVDNGPTNGFDMSVMRFTANGALDPSFSFDGRAVVSFADGTGTDVCNALAVQSDGKILLAGYTQPSAGFQRFAIARFNTDGSLDTTSFGSGTGKVTVTFSSTSGANSIAVQRDGKIVVAGTISILFSSNVDFEIIRLNTDGTLDTSFNSTGRQTIAFDNPVAGGTRADVATAVAVDSQDRIVVAGYAEGVSNDNDFAVARLLPNGTLDTAFNTSGKQVIPFNRGGSNTDVAYGLTVQHDDKIVLAGAVMVSAVSNSFDMGLVRLQPDGALDTGFGAGGKVVIPIDLVTDGGDFATGVVEQGNGKLLVTGFADDVSSSVALVATRLQRNGSVDTTFGSSGIRHSILGSTNFNPSFGIALQGTQIIVGGIMSVGSNYDLFVTRLNNDLLFADQFE